MAQIVISCHNPPSLRGANAKPYSTGGGDIFICQIFHVGPMAAPHRIKPTPKAVKNMVVIPKKPTKNGPTQKSNKSPPMSVPPRIRYFLSKLRSAIVVLPAVSRSISFSFFVATGGLDRPLQHCRNSYKKRLGTICSGTIKEDVSAAFLGPSIQLNRSVLSKMK